MNLVRLFIVVLVASLPLLGAAELLQEPVVVVYPLTATSDIGSVDTGSSVGTAIANKLVQLGGITVKPYISGTTRQQYLTAAVSQDADYYITGYITALGSEVSVVEQVVSTRSGSIVYSTTAFARTFADAAAPAEALRDAILRHAGRGMASLDAPPPSASPAPILSKGGVNISQAFGRHRKATPTPAVSTTAAVSPGAPVAVSPGPGKPGPAIAANTPPARATGAAVRVAFGGDKAALVIETAGTADPAVRTYASQSLASALRRDGIAGAFLPVTNADIGSHAADLCRANAAANFYAPALAISGAERGAGIALDVVAYDCNALTTGREHVQRSAKAATRNAVEGAIDAATADLAKRLRRDRGAAIRATPPAKS